MINIIILINYFFNFEFHRNVKCNSPHLNHNFSREPLPTKSALQATKSVGAQPIKSCKKYLSAKLSDSASSSSSPSASSCGSKRKISASRSWDSVCCPPTNDNSSKLQQQPNSRNRQQQPSRASPKLPIALSTAKLLRRHGMQQRAPPVDVREAFRLGRRSMVDNPSKVIEEPSNQERYELNIFKFLILYIGTQKPIHNFTNFYTQKTPETLEL